MNILQTGFPGLLVIGPQVFEDERGYFFESYQLHRFNEKAGISQPFIQDNESKSAKGTVRGLHYQLGDFAQAKLVRVIQGSVFDVVVDIRKGSPTFGEWYGIELNDKNKKQLYVPRGFAHGFSVLSESAIFSYKCDNLYNKSAERSIHPFDSTLNIDWKVDKQSAIVSNKDMYAPLFTEAEMNFNF